MLPRPIPVMVNGIPGNVACTVARQPVHGVPRFAFVPVSFTGQEIAAGERPVADVAVRLIRPDAREAALAALRRTHGEFLSVDYTHPSTVQTPTPSSTAATGCRS